MLREGKTYIYSILLAFCFCVSSVASAQELTHSQKLISLLAEGDSLRMQYRFKESLDAYTLALQITEDELYVGVDSLLKLDLQDKVLMSENGLNMMGFVDVPHVVARQKFSIEDFFLFYPLQDSSWRAIPNQLDSTANHCFSRAIYIQNQDKTIYWSAPDTEGIRNIYTSSLRDSIWTLPSLLNEQMISASDEIYPMISPDGKSLFFSSAGLYGVGGYDLYVSKWNEDTNEWGAPVNMGFPYSSPADDFLYIDTEDGHHSLFASNRDCPQDSVWVYALEFDNVPVRRSIKDSDELSEITKLVPTSTFRGVQGSAHLNSPEIQEYIVKLKTVKTLKDSVSLYSALAAEGKPSNRLISFKDSLSVLHTQLQLTEMKFMMKGIVVDLDEILNDGEGESVALAEEYTFEKKSWGDQLKMNFEVPEVKFDYSFKVLDIAQFAEDQTIPSGIVYQIQIFASKNKASIKALKGLSPVYETKTANGSYVYKVGLFRTYSDVLAHLNTVKKVGFRNAFISAYIDGKSVTVSKARAKEKEKPAVQEFYEVSVTPAGGELDPGVAAGIRQQAAGKDIARTVSSDGVVKYVVGPFADKTKAEDLTLFIKAMGVTDVVCGVIRK